MGIYTSLYHPVCIMPARERRWSFPDMVKLYQYHSPPMGIHTVQKSLRGVYKPKIAWLGEKTNTSLPKSGLLPVRSDETTATVSEVLYLFVISQRNGSSKAINLYFVSFPTQEKTKLIQVFPKIQAHETLMKFLWGPSLWLAHLLFGIYWWLINYPTLRRYSSHPSVSSQDFA